MGEVPVVEDFPFIDIKFIKIGIDNGEAIGYQSWSQFLSNLIGVISRYDVDSVRYFGDASDGFNLI
ncbi:hypothetical protein ES703_24469 [subsurface metagenome]